MPSVSLKASRDNGPNRLSAPDKARSSSARPSILVLLWYYLPGLKSGGPLVSIANLVESLGDEFSFRIVTSDRDPGDTARYPGIKVNQWHNVGKAQVLYIPPGLRGVPSIARVMRETAYDMLLLNSFVNRRFTVFPLLARRAGVVPRRPVLLSPRGEFTKGALDQKYAQKRAYISFVQRSGLMSDIWFHATNPQEEEDIGRTVPSVRGIVNVPDMRILRAKAQCPVKELDSRLRLVFLSRIDRMKNLDFALAVLSKCETPVTFDIYGPVTQSDYWEECQRHIKALPPHIEVRYFGAIANSDVPSTLGAYDLFFLPTLGENFCHAIFDALEAELPVLISDQTPWKELETKEAGWSLPLSDPNAFTAAIDKLARMSSAERTRLRLGARRVAENHVNKSDLIDSYRRMFQHVLTVGIEAGS